MITTMQCSISSQLNNKHRVVVTDFRLHHTCSIIILWLHSLSGVIRSLLCNPRAFSPAIIIESVDSIIESVDSISRDERDVPLTQYITNA